MTCVKMYKCVTDDLLNRMYKCVTDDLLNRMYKCVTDDKCVIDDCLIECTNV